MSDDTGQLTRTEWELVIESLTYTKQKFEEYRYPSREIQKEQISAVTTVLSKARAARKAAA